MRVALPLTARDHSTGAFRAPSSLPGVSAHTLVDLEQRRRAPRGESPPGPGAARVKALRPGSQAIRSQVIIRDQATRVQATRDQASPSRSAAASASTATVTGCGAPATAQSGSLSPFPVTVHTMR